MDQLHGTGHDAFPVIAKGDVRLLVGVASGRDWSPFMGQSYGMMMLHLGLHHLGGRLACLQTCIKTQAYLVTARNELLCSALDEGYTHFLSLDDDMVFPADLVEQMLAHDLPVVTANYRKKTDERLECVCTDFTGKNLDSTGKTGLEPIRGMGMGCTLIKLDAIRHVPRPFFAVVWNRDFNDYIIEDGVFSLKLAEYGVPIHCDHDLSRQVGHVGAKQYWLPPAAVGLATSPGALLPVVAEKADDGGSTLVQRSAA